MKWSCCFWKPCFSGKYRVMENIRSPMESTHGLFANVHSWCEITSQYSENFRGIRQKRHSFWQTSSKSLPKYLESIQCLMENVPIVLYIAYYFGVRSPSLCRIPTMSCREYCVSVILPLDLTMEIIQIGFMHFAIRFEWLCGLNFREVAFLPLGMLRIKIVGGATTCVCPIWL